MQMLLPTIPNYQVFAQLQSYRYMQQIELNQRQISLQRIIKAQQARISDLQAKLAQGNNLEKLKLEAAVKELTLKYQHKEKQVAQLKQEQVKYKTDLRDSRENLKYSRMYERDSLVGENKSLQNKVKEMQDRIRNQTERNESDVTKLLKMNQALQKQINFYKSSVTSIELEIEKLQIFYRSALVQLPKRVDTLQWVDNFIRFMNQYEATLVQKPLQPGIDKIQKELLEFKNQFTNKAKEMMESNNSKVGQLHKAKEEVQGIIVSHLKQVQQIVDENDKFWESIKKQKISKASENQKKLQQQISQLKQQHTKEITSLSSNLKTFEQQKRDLNLAFLELKGYYEHREKALNDEIKILKQNSDKLIQMGEKRQQTFQAQVSKLSSEVTELTRRYQDNIRIPFEEFNKRFATDMRSIIQQIGSFPYKEKCGHILNRLDGRCREAELLIKKSADRQVAAEQALEKYVSNIRTIQHNLQKNIKFIIDTIEHYGDQNLSNDFIQEEEQLYDQTITKMELEELEARKNYEIQLLKHNNYKLQQVITRLQATGTLTEQHYEKHNRVPQNSETEVKILKNLVEQYSVKFHQQIKKLRFAKYDKQVINVIAENLSKYEGLLHQMRDYTENIIIESIKTQNQQSYEYLDDIKITAKQIQQFIETPAKRLNQLVKYNEQVNLIPKSQVANLSRASETIQILSNFKQQVKAYKQLLSEKEKPKSNIGKILSQLIQVLRSSMPAKQPLTQKQNEDNKTSRKNKTEGGLERRIRDIQASRLKDKSQVSTVLERLGRVMKKMEAPRNKNKQCQQILTRAQLYLRDKMQYIIGMLEYPLKGKQPINEFNQVAKKTIQDLESKLKEAVYENQGLVKEFKLLTNFNQTFRDGAESKRLE